MGQAAIPIAQIVGPQLIQAAMGAMQGDQQPPAPMQIANDPAQQQQMVMQQLMQQSMQPQQQMSPSQQPMMGQNDPLALLRTLGVL